jgi:DNA-binding transcriptional ArsR family regulator
MLKACTTSLRQSRTALRLRRGWAITTDHYLENFCRREGFWLTSPTVSSSLRFVETYHQRQLDALGDVTRRALLERLRHGPLPVGELARSLPVSRPAVSQHLKVLKRARLVNVETVGTRNYYRVDPQGIAALRSYFDKFWEEALEAFKAKIEEEE